MVIIYVKVGVIIQYYLVKRMVFIIKSIPRKQKKNYQNIEKNEIHGIKVKQDYMRHQKNKNELLVKRIVVKVIGIMVKNVNYHRVLD